MNAIRPTSERIRSLDVLRGFALLGILVMNIQSFSMIEIAYFNPTAYGDLEGANRVVWYLSSMLFDTKFMAIFSMLFGASALLIVERTRSRGGRPFAVHARRNLALLAIGFGHGQFLWHGDILYHYALCAFIIYPFRNRSPRALFITGALILAIGSSLWLMAGLTADEWPQDSAEEHVADWQPGTEAVQEELDVYRGSWSEQNSHRRSTATEMQTFVFLFYFAWRVRGLMLIGMGLYKLGVLSAQRSRRFYGILIAAGIVVGLPLAHLRVSGSVASGWDAFDALFVYTQYNWWGSLAVALGWIGLVMLFCKSAAWLGRLGPLVAVGRMAFTNYLMQTVVCTTLFYGHGFGMFGRLERVEQIGVVLGVWVLQLVGSPLWLRYFHYGPAEWLWRAATLLRWPAFRK